MIKGRADFLKIGDWNFICDRCGNKRKASDAMFTWDNLRVCPKCFERRHPSDFIRGVPDDQSTSWTRSDSPDRAAVDIEGNTAPFLGSNTVVGDTDKTLTVGTDSIAQTWSTTLTANRTVVLSTTSARVGNVFTIYRTAGGAFTLDVGGLQTIPANIKATVVVTYTGSAWILESYTPSGL